MKVNKKLIAATALTVLMTMPLMTMALETTDAIFTPPNSQDVTLLEIVVKVVEIVWIVFVAISIVMFIIAGVFFMTAQGDPEKTSQGRMFVIYAFVGILVAILAFSAAAIVKTTFDIS